MSNNKMTVDERRKYLSIVKPRYIKAGRAEKGQILDEMEAVTGMDRKTFQGTLRSLPLHGLRTWLTKGDGHLCVTIG